MSIDPLWLSNHPLFSTFSDSDRSALAKAGEVLTFRRGEVVSRGEDSSSNAWLIRSGYCLVVSSANPQKTTILALHGPGDTHGMLTPFGGESQGDLVSLGATVAVRLPVRKIWDALAGQSAAIEALGKLAAQWCTEREERISILSNYTAEARLRHLLHLLARRWGEQGNQGIHLAAPITHRVLADLAGISREKATRALGRLKEQGHLRANGRKLIVPDMKLLFNE